MADFKFYEKDGRSYDRVSTILDAYKEPGLIDWEYRVGKKQAGQVKRSATKIGSRVHGLIEDFYVKGSYELAAKELPDVVNCMKAFDRWQEDYGIEIVGTEEKRYCEELLVAGTSDLRAKSMMIDIKTSGKISDKYWLQLAIYSNMYFEEIGEIPDNWKLAVLRLDKNLGEYEWVVRDYDPHYMTVFKGMVHMHRYFNPGHMPKDKEDNNVHTVTNNKVGNRQELELPKVPNDRASQGRQE